MSIAHRYDWQLRFKASDRERLLVSSPVNPAFNVHSGWLTTFPDDAWRNALVSRLTVDLAGKRSAAVTSVVQRAIRYLDRKDDDRLTGFAIACRILAEAKGAPPRLELEAKPRDDLLAALTQANLTCSSSPRASKQP